MLEDLSESFLEHVDVPQSLALFLHALFHEEGNIPVLLLRSSLNVVVCVVEELVQLVHRDGGSGVEGRELVLVEHGEAFAALLHQGVFDFLERELVLEVGVALPPLEILLDGTQAQLPVCVAAFLRQLCQARPFEPGGAQGETR